MNPTFTKVNDTRVFAATSQLRHFASTDNSEVKSSVTIPKNKTKLKSYSSSRGQHTILDFYDLKYVFKITMAETVTILCHRYFEYTLVVMLSKL